MIKALETAREIILKLPKGKNTIQYQKLWKEVCAKLKTTKANDEDALLEFYMAILEDPTFIKTNDNEWTLKELFSYDEVEKINSAIYATEEFDIVEEEYQNYMSNYEMNELKHKNINSDTTALALEEIEAPAGDDIIEDEIQVEEDEKDIIEDNDEGENYE